MRFPPMLSTILLGALAASTAMTATQAGSQWHQDLESGVKAARKSGRPLLVVTAWKSGI